MRPRKVHLKPVGSIREREKLIIYLIEKYKVNGWEVNAVGWATEWEFNYDA